MSEPIVVLALLMGALASYLLLFSRKSAHGPLTGSKLDVDAGEDTITMLRRSTLATRLARPGAPIMKRLFSVSNPFVCDSAAVQSSYRQAVYKAIAQVDDRAWVAVARTVARAAKPLLCRRSWPNGTDTITADLRHMSLNTSLAAVLKTFFDIDDVPHEQLSWIAYEIHHVMHHGKLFLLTGASVHEIPEDLLRRVDALIQTLQNLFTEHQVSTELAQTILYSVSGSPDDFNPLNLLIPAFEAPWRANLYTILSVLQPGPSSPDYLLALRGCPAAHPLPPLAQAIAYESLRLYPPVRRVSRIPRFVDIEAIQRDPVHWGSTAQRFDSSRFLKADGKHVRSSLVGSQQFAWIPFAAGAMKCPSSRVFSARMIVVVVGEILRHLFPGDSPPDWEMTGEEWDAAARRGDVLRSGRNEYNGVNVVSILR
ncbi:uncharacterized protein BP01DRAFT_364139 [Aspergillus saccharolyticus JOP 1030-1]|uniref:Cytochrome P450 n=1 Tax=Aspergillus saccharolyticus JOP 1030-1 TaxID=1450539 RepID=A0A318ZI10_9EURO|nr:hypothetical protein BP01DRAFT_364139 [Aspergillus saccharolyticus JOP 1030-1]PYH47129.1 hypothetical protein BP01DRAFT_364139 [Aspergillus saccharolyticus JOP 1030-1]